MKTTDAELRRSADQARLVIEKMFEGLPSREMRGYMQFLSSSLKFLHSEHNDRWGITLRKDSIRLNVGWVEVLFLEPSGLRVLVKQDLTKGFRLEGRSYRSAPGCDDVLVPLSKIAGALPPLLKAHHRAISIAAKRKTNKSIREAHSVGATRFLSEFLHQPVVHPSYQIPQSVGRDYLVLWKYSEAVRVNGMVVVRAEGSHASGLAKGDRMFVAATRGNKLFLLGAIAVEKTGKGWSSGSSLFGPFRILPLRALTWKLRFNSPVSTQLSSQSDLAWQVRSRRWLTPESGLLLERFLPQSISRQDRRFTAYEGRQKQFELMRRERDPNVRRAALEKRGWVCEICGLNFATRYGEFAATCVEVHHIEPLAKASARGTRTSVEDVIVLCPNCHRALHRYRNPMDWKGFKRKCGLG